MRGGRFTRVTRYAEYLYNWLVRELPHGLDFSMRAKSARIGTAGSTGYALTSKKALRNILKGIEITRDDAFLDIGCGKGGVICFAADYEFGYITGIDSEPWLVERAAKNIRVLGLEDRVKAELADALDFSDYGQYNFYFLFNPFDSDTYDQVVERIATQMRASSRPVWLICYGDSSERAIRNAAVFELIRSDVCPYRGNDIRIWRSELGPS